MRVLREPSMLTLLLASPQVLDGGAQIVLLTVEFTHAHVHVGRAPHDRLAMLRGKLQPPLVDAHRLAETTSGNPDISQRECATDGVSDVPGPLEARHAIAIR